ncbi:RDD family protein [Streptomyces sp. NPDC001508]|uniref:RDD family protein n=1 Tax=Streptomyces sp. NPDC001508 TaxID=3154656 RepID=UPI0033165A85
MSAPTPAPGDDRPREGYYPDPSIPGYVRYWNGAAWVPGTSRPAPRDGEPLSPPAGTRPAAPAVEETGPHFFDEDPQPEPAGPQPEPAGPQPEPAGPEPASAWSADRSRQSGFGGEPDRRVSWGGDPRVPADPPPAPDGRATSTDGTATIPPAESGDLPASGTFVFRRPVPGPAAAPAAEDEGTMTFRAVPRTGEPGAAAPADRSGPAFGPRQGPPGPAGSGGSGGSGAAIPAQGSGADGSASAAASAPGAGGAASPAPSPAASSATGSGGPGFGAGKAAAARAAAAQDENRAAGAAARTATPSVPQQSTPVTSGRGGGQSSWAQQVHRLAGGGDEQPVAPWKPPAEDPFQAMVRRQAAARPAALGKRLAARLIDTAAVGAVTAVAAVPLGTRAADHIQEKIDAAELSGRTVTVWLLDGTTGTYLGIVLAVLLLAGVLYEVLPTAKWGRTLGKRLCGLEVRDIEGHEPPAFGASLRRWLVHTVPGLLGIGVVGYAWCLFDRPWHQCWHDKAAHTFVAG